MSELKSYLLPGKAHLLMGFHDTSAIDAASGRMVVLGVDCMDRPPVAGDKAAVCIADWDSGEVRQVAETDAWNFPQGSRQHFVGGAAITYNLSIDGEWAGVVQDLGSGRRTQLEKALYAVHPTKGVGYGFNFARLHRLGGYGYVGCKDATATQPAPKGDGLWEVDLVSGRGKLLVSIREACTATGASLPVDQPHYFTHVVPSPSGKQLCFLHRYWLPDGGIQTRLLVCAADGSGLHCRAEGYLSHFDWVDDEVILIWGRPPSSLQKGRNHPVLRLPGVRQAVQWSKPLLRRVLGKSAGTQGSYMLIPPGGFAGQSFGSGLLTEDGHPSFKPGARDWLLTDTYPDKEGWRTLMICPVKVPIIHVLARLQEAKIKARMDMLAGATAGMDAAVLRSFKTESFAHTRSGIHCDFHPRWRPDGRAVCFDSNHEGVRKIYSLDVDKHVVGGEL
jgi:hypothetical protein